MAAKLKVLVVGSGGREHALAWKAVQSKLVECVYVAPGNAGTELEAGMENVAIAADDIHKLADFATREQIDLTIIGAEVPLVLGIVDEFTERGLQCFGPQRAAAMLEGSKIFAKEFLLRHSIPTAAYHTFNDADDALKYLQSAAYPLVIKADGLAAGKGVVIAESQAQAESTVISIMQDKQFGDAGNRLVCEQFLQGEEASFICMVDGKDVLPMASSQDHKAANDGDTGANTGGMGAYSPAPIVDEAMHQQIMDKVIYPTVNGLAKDGMPYRGFLYAGLMIGDDGVPNVLEFNCRFGDPETQPIMLRMRSDLIAHCLAAMQGKLANEHAEWDSQCAVGVVMAAAGYPNKSETGGEIRGLTDNESAKGDTDSPPQKVFHAGTGFIDDKIVVTGGRVVCATASGDNIRAAQQSAYQLVKKINWDGCWYRTDIGHRAIQRENSDSA